jgi:hypothetical protein
LTVKVLPTPASLATSTAPPCSATIALDDIQADANPMNMLDRYLRHTIKALEQLGQRVGRDANTVITHVEQSHRRAIVGREITSILPPFWLSRTGLGADSGGSAPSP